MGKVTAKQYRRKFTKSLMKLNEQGCLKVEGSYVMTSKYVFRILDEEDELHTQENLEKLKNCRILYNELGEKLVIMRELIKLGQNPTDRKFFTL